MNQEKDYNSILLEELRGDIKALAEGQSGLERRMNEKFGEVYKRFDDMDANFKQVFEYLSNIEEEVQSLRKDLEENYEKKGWDATWRKQIEEKLERIEKSLERKDLLTRPVGVKRLYGVARDK